MADKKHYMVTRGFFADGERKNVGDVVELTEWEAGRFHNHLVETEAPKRSAPKRSTKAEGLPE